LKNSQGKLHGGEGKEHFTPKGYQGVTLHRSGPNPALKVEGGVHRVSKSTGGSAFDPQSKGYRGPSNMTPENHGVVNPDDVTRSGLPK
jgi:hypothetical protein